MADISGETGMEARQGLDLHCRVIEHPTAEAPVLVLLHGMFGSGANLAGLGRGFADSHRVLLPDLRNHGRSPRADVMTYPAMVADLVRLLDRQGVERCVLVGHSMGGKVAMLSALTHPERLDGLAVLDMAPVTYAPRFGELFRLLDGLPLERLINRQQADEWLARELSDPRLRGFLLHSLERGEKAWRWRFNLHALMAQADALRSFPEPTPESQFPGPALFLHGEQSDYLRPEHWPQVRRLFPMARVQGLPDAGHWLHADRPAEVLALLRAQVAA